MHFASTEEFAKWVTFTPSYGRKYKMRPGITILDGRAVVRRKIALHSSCSRVDQSWRAWGQNTSLCAIFAEFLDWFLGYRLKKNSRYVKTVSEEWDVMFAQKRFHVCAHSTGPTIPVNPSFIDWSLSVSYVPRTPPPTHPTGILCRCLYIFP